MTKSISRSQVRLIASTNAIFGAGVAAHKPRRDVPPRQGPQTYRHYHKAIKPQHKGACFILLRTVP